MLYGHVGVQLDEFLIDLLERLSPGFRLVIPVPDRDFTRDVLRSRSEHAAERKDGRERRPSDRSIHYQSSRFRYCLSSTIYVITAAETQTKLREDVLGQSTNAQRPDRSGLRAELRVLLEALDGGPPVDFETLDPVEERAASEIRLRGLAGDLEQVARVENLKFGNLPVRIYRPAGATHTVLFIHGGGWVVGSLDTHDNSCRILANESQCNVVAIGYRKAPENAFPAAVADCDAALDWLIAEAPKLRLDVS